MLKILQARLQQYVNWELPDVQGRFRKDRGTTDQIADIHRITEKVREFQKNIYCCFIDYAKAFDCVDQNKLWKNLKEIEIPDHITLRSLYAGQEATVITRRKNWFKIGKRVWQGWLAYLTSVWSTSSERVGWMSHKLESSLLGEISTTSDMQMIPC